MAFTRHLPASRKQDKLFHGDLCATLLAWAELLQCNTKEEKLSVLSAASKYSHSAMTSFLPEPLTSALRDKVSQGCLTLPAMPIWRTEMSTSPSMGVPSPWLGTSPAVAFHPPAELWSAGSQEDCSEGRREVCRAGPPAISTEVQHQSLHWAEVCWKSSEEVGAGGTRCPGVTPTTSG